MSLEQSIQNLADAINNLAKSQQFASAELSHTIVTGFNQAEAPVVEKPKAEPKVEKAKPAAAEKPVEKTPEPAKAEEPKAVEGEVITADEKTEEEIRQEAFGAPDGYIYKPFISLGQGGKNVAAQKAICAQFGVQRISLVAVDQIPAMKAAVEAALAEVQG